MMTRPFRFGIMEMQMKSLLPDGEGDVMAKLAGLTHHGLAGSLADEGFDLIELGGDLVLFFPHFYTPEAIEKLAELKQSRGLSFTVHLPLWSVEPSTPLQPVREGSVRAMVDMIRATQPLEPENYVLHATGALAAEFTQKRFPAAGRALLLRQFQAAAVRSLETILRETGLPSRKLSVETIEFPFELNAEIVETLDLSWCLDTGHILAGFSGQIEFSEALDRVLPRLAEIHLHDCPRPGPDGRLQYGKDHQALGHGDLDVPYLLRRLKEARYQGPVIFELTVAEAQESLRVIDSFRKKEIE